jgi:hypothetical protein
MGAFWEATDFHPMRKNMTAIGLRFEFKEYASIKDIEVTLLLAATAAEGLFGAARIRLEFNYSTDGPRRTITVDDATEVGQTIVKIFTCFLLYEMNQWAFRVRRVETHPAGRTEDYLHGRQSPSEVCP